MFGQTSGPGYVFVVDVVTSGNVLAWSSSGLNGTGF